MASNEVRVKNEPIYESESILETSGTNQPNSLQSNNKQLIKHEIKSIQINDSKRAREDISIDNNPDNEQPNKRRRQSIVATKIKEEPIDSEIQTSKSHIENRSEEEVEVKSEEMFSETKEFTTIKSSIQTISIAFLNEKDTTVTSIDNHPKTINSQSNNPQKKKTNQLDNSK